MRVALDAGGTTPKHAAEGATLCLWTLAWYAGRGRAAALTRTPIRPQDVGIGRLFERARDAVVIGDVDSGHIVLWNPAAEQLFGYTAAEAVGQLLEVVVPESLRE